MVNVGYLSDLVRHLHDDPAEWTRITPPLGLDLDVIQTVARVSLEDVARGVWPFLALMLLTVVILYLWPDLALNISFKW